MIPKGNLHAHGGRLATYITKGEDDERAELVEMRGFASDDLRAAFCDIQAIAESQTQCQKPFFHAYVRLPADEALTKEQWIETADRLGEKLGFEDQPRGVALHFLDDGTTHMHVAWSRIDTDQMKAIDPGLYLRKMKEVCRDLEKEFGLREVSSDLSPERQTAAAKRPEFEEARRLGLEVVDIRETIRSCFDRSDNGLSFAAALAEHGMGVARGDRRDYVVIDSECGMHALGKRICGVATEEIRERFGEPFRQSLPGVDELRGQMEARREAGRDGNRSSGGVAPAEQRETASGYPRSRAEIAAEVTALFKASDSGQSFAASLHERGYILARGDRRDFLLIDSDANHYSLPRLIDGARTADIRAKLADIDTDRLPDVAEAKAAMALRTAITGYQRGRGTMTELSSEQVDEQPRLEAQRWNDAAEQERRLQEQRLQNLKQQQGNSAEEAKRIEPQRRKDDERRAAEGEDNSAENRYAQALGQNYDMRDPYGSLARAAMAEHGAFKRQQEDLRKEIAATKDPQEREALQHRQRIEGFEYMAITSQRIAGISDAVSGKDSTQGTADRERAEFWKQEVAKAHEQRAQMMEARQKQEPQQQRGDNDRGTQAREAAARAADAQAQATAGLRPNETRETRAATPEARRGERDAQDSKAAGVDKTGSEPTRQQQQGRGSGGGRGR